MPGNKKKARQMWKSGRASVCEDDRSIPHEEWGRGMRLLWAPFAALLVLYVLWEAMSW